MDSVANRKFFGICSCMWEYLHLTIPPRIKLPRIAAITRKLPRSSLFSYQIIWMAGFFFYFPHSPFWNLPGPTFYMRFFSTTLSGCLKPCLDYWPWGKERESLNLICVTTYFKTFSSKLDRGCACDCQFIIVASHNQNWIWLLLSHRLAPKREFLKVECHFLLMPYQPHLTPWCRWKPTSLHRPQPSP